MGRDVENRGRDASTHVLRELLMETAAFTLLTVSIVVLWRDNLLLFVVAFVECLMVLWVWHEQYDLYFFATIATLSSIAEAVFVHFGVWRYANPTFLGVPLWFPVAFGTAAVVGQRLVRTTDSVVLKAKHLQSMG